MKRVLLILVTIFLLLFNACSRQEDIQSDQTPPEGEAQASEPMLISLWLPPYLPAGLSSDIRLPEGLVASRDKNSADLMLDVSDEALVARWVYALVAPFPTIETEVKSTDLMNFWSGDPAHELPITTLLVDGNTKAILEKIWGPASNMNVQVLTATDLLASAWEREGAWAIIPFELVEPQWKVLKVDGQSPLDKSLSVDRYPLVIPFSVIGSAEKVADYLAKFGKETGAPVFQPANWDAGKLTAVLVTGVTALVRGTAYLMEVNGMTYPAIDIGDLLRSADILHISNEIAFSPTCPNPTTNKSNDANLVFCSKPEYIQLLEAVGTDVVELTGDHFIDTSDQAMLDTIAMYEERGWQYYGGGKDFTDGIQPALFEHNGNKIAFLGCNAKPKGYSRAGENVPGAVHCDMELMAGQIRDVLDAGYLPIFTFQHLEYYSYKINKNLVDDFHAAADAGAVIVSGSQAHMPHGFEFYKGGFLHYGLGNLFFDQYRESLEQRDAFLDWHVIYDDRYISTQLIPIRFIDLARPRLMTTEESDELLEKVFSASGWK